MNSVNKTLYIPLYGKAMVSKCGIILDDKTAERIWNQNAVPLGRKSKSEWLAYFMAMRARVFDEWVIKALDDHPEAVVLHIGCGLDSRVDRVHGYKYTWYDIDLPEVIGERKKYYTERNNYRMLPGDAANPGFLSDIPSGGTAVIIMEGISMYLSPDAIQNLFASFSKHFSVVRLLMDVYTGFGAKMTKIKNPVNEVGVTQTFGIDDPELPLGKSDITFIRENTMTPPELISELRGFKKLFFRPIFAGGFAKKIYKLYEYIK